MTVVTRRRPTLRLRPKNQFTLPEAIAREMGAAVGDRFFIATDGPDRLILERVPKSYAGSLPGLWGTPDEANAYIRDTREGWGRRERRQLGR